MKPSDLRPGCTNKVEFSYSSLRSISATSGCYVLSNWREDILYIGQAKSIRRRIISHLSDSAKTSMTAMGRAFWVHYELCDEFSLNQLERGWMQQHENREGKLPILNRIQPPSV